jgi:dienelactone hydrolase
MEFSHRSGTMPCNRIRSLVTTLGWLVALCTACFADEPQRPTETVSVSKTCDGRPFVYQIRLAAERTQFRVYRLSYPSPTGSALTRNNTVPADYYVPKQVPPGGHRYPAVICLHILDGNEPLTELVCSVLANRGVPALSFKLPYYGPRGGPRGPEALADDPKMFVGAITQAGEDIRRTIDLLASRPEINPERIGIAGISLGGIIAASAAGAEPRLGRAALILSGGDLLNIIHHARETRPLSVMIGRLPPAERSDLEAKLEAVDPLRFAPALRGRAQNGKVLMINAAEDEVIPRACTEKLAQALGLEDRVTWLEGLGHYTAMAELPHALRTTAEFFAQDLPADAQAATPAPPVDPNPLQRLVAVLQQAITILVSEPAPGQCHFVDLNLSAFAATGRPFVAHLRLVRGAQGRFALRGRLPELGDVVLGQGRFPWLVAGGKTLVAGTKNPVANTNALTYVEPRHLQERRMLDGVGGALGMAPEMLGQWITVSNDNPAGGHAIRVAAQDARKIPGDIHLAFQEDGRTPASATFSVAGLAGKVRFHGWQTDTVAPEALFEPPAGLKRVEVEQADVCRIFAALLNFGAEYIEPGRERPDVHQTAMSVMARDPAGHGLLCRSQGKWILMVSGTPAQMGTAQGRLVPRLARKIAERVVYLGGGADTLASGEWFADRMAEIERRTLPYIPPRFLEECDALARAVGVSERDARYANLFPERFHCSGVALRGQATVGGRVLHARVLDYMTEIGLQDGALVTVFMPEGHHRWMSLGYAGFIGTVTAMNERGLSIGEMGGRGEGQWDGTPMSLLLRDVMERAATVDEALAILRAARRTCQYYYVLSDRSGELRAVECTPTEMTVLEPGQQNPRLPPVPSDTVLISGDERAKLLSQRIQENYGRIDVPKLMEIIKRPVAMHSNLHDAIFAPETLEMWFADAGRETPACDEPYAHVKLAELIEFYAAHVALPRE